MELIGKVLKRYPHMLQVGISQALLIVSFQLFGILSVYWLIALALGIFFMLVYFPRLSNRQQTDLGLMLTTITIFILFLSISPLYLESGSWLRNVLLAFGFPSIYWIGYVLIHWQKITVDHLFKMVMIGLSFFVFINVVYTLFRYLPFYRLLYQGQVIYVDGEMYQVAAEAKWLIGLQFVEVKVLYMDMYLTLLLMPLVGNLHLIQDFRHWRRHVWWWIPSITAILGIVLLPSFLPLIMTMILGISWGILKYFNRPQASRIGWIDWGFKVGAIVLAFFVGSFFIETWNVFGLGDLLKEIPYFGRYVLDFPLIEAYQSVLRSASTNPLGGFAPILVGNQNLLSTHSLVFDTLHQGGIFAFFGLIVLTVFLINQLWHFHLDHKVSAPIRRAMILVIAAFMLGQLFFLELYPFIREGLRNRPRLVIDEPLYLLMFLLMGAIMVDPLKGWIKEKKTSTKRSAKSHQAATLHKGKRPLNSPSSWRRLD